LFSQCQADYNMGIINILNNADNDKYDKNMASIISLSSRSDE